MVIRTPYRAFSIASRAIAVALVMLVGLAGCAPLRLPRIDPTGERIFLPYPEASTELNCPPAQGGGGLLPRPAFTTPPPVPPCPQGPLVGPGVLPPAMPAGAVPAPAVTAPDDCVAGPPAVLVGDKHGHHAHLRHLLHLPERGKRGRILLSPRRIIAPVGGEVLLLSGICGTEGYLMTGEPLEWMLAPDGVGNFVQVGVDDRHHLLRLASSTDPEKVTGQFARGITSTQPQLITRGNLSLRDDVRVKKGEGWITLSSASEGVSRVTVLAPESECWDHRKATATIYWIDASWKLPPPQVVMAGTPVTLVTEVMRSEATIPAEGWIVRYEMLTPTLGGFAPDSRSVQEVRVDAQGRAAVQLLPAPGTRGTATVEIQVIRPAEADLPRMTLTRGETTVTWTAADLALQASAPNIATLDRPVPIQATLSNPGDLDAENVQLTARLPAGVQIVSSTVAGQPLAYTVAGDQVRWEIGRLPARRQVQLELTVTARERFRMLLTARADRGLMAEAAVDVEVFRPSLEVRVVPAGSDRATVGDEVQFNIDVTNTGDRPLQDVQLNAIGGEGLVHLQTGQMQVHQELDSPLGPGETWSRGIKFVLQQAGEQCIRVAATAAGGQQAQGQACVIGIRPPPATPAVNARISTRPEIAAGEQLLAKFFVQNEGHVPLTNIRVTATYDALLEPMQATEEMFETIGQSQISWIVPRLESGQEILFEATFEAVRTGTSNLFLTVESAEGAQASGDMRVQVQPPAAAPPAATPPPATTPPATTPPATTPPPSAPGTGPQAPPLPAERGAAPPLGAAPGALRLFLGDRRDPALVGEDIPYTLTIENDRAVPDSAVRVQIQLPAGVELVRANPVGVPGGDQVTFPEEGIAQLPEIRSLRAGELVDYAIVLRSNQPRTLRVRVEATSRLAPEGVSATEETTVQPRP